MNKPESPAQTEVDQMERIVQREVNSGLTVLNYAITENLPETAKEVARWMAGVALELTPHLCMERHMTFSRKQYILIQYQNETGAR